MKINVITLCSGYDSQCMALDLLKEKYIDFDYDLIAWAEFDPESKQPLDKQPAVVAHKALYPQWADRNVGDMTKVDWSKYAHMRIDLLTYSTPCTDISNAGLQKGLEEGSGTRSSILWYTRNAIQELHPKYLMLENVKALVGKKFISYFNAWLRELEQLGYKSYWQVCNASDYGVAQNRERVFVISVRDDHDENERPYTFPKPFPLEKCVEDYLENEEDVPESYYCKDEQVQKFIELIQKEN